MEQKPILLQGAMECEIRCFLRELKDKKEVTLQGYPFYTGTIQNVPVVVSLTAYGMTNVSLATFLGIQEFSPSLVINQGTAGAHHEQMVQGDIVLGKRLVNLGSYCSAVKKAGEGYAVAHRETMPVKELKEGKELFLNELSSTESYLHLAEQCPCATGRLISGTIGTSDGWNRETDYIHALHEYYGTDCEEMESFAMAQVCRKMEVSCLAVRVISNNEITGTAFDEKYAEECQDYVMTLLPKLRGCQ